MVTIGSGLPCTRWVLDAGANSPLAAAGADGVGGTDSENDCWANLALGLPRSPTSDAW